MASANCLATIAEGNGLGYFLPREALMDLGIAGRTAIVCASSRGLGRGAALALAEARCDLIINGRDAGLLEREATPSRCASASR